MTKKKSECLVICPIGDKNAQLGTPEREVWERSIETWERLIEPACQEAGIEALRADHIDETGEIPEQVCRLLRTAELVIADLTSGNANVMYELGLRHTTGLPTVQIGERGRLPFDVSAIRTNMFIRTEYGYIAARKELVSTLKSALAGRGLPVTATRVWLSFADDSEPRQKQATSLPLEEAEGLVDLDEPGYLEKMVSSQQGLESLASKVEPMTRAVEEINQVWETATEEIRRSDATGGGAGGRLAAAERAARRLERIEPALRDGVEDFSSTIHSVAPGLDFILDQIGEGFGGEKVPGVFVGGLRTLGQTVEKSNERIATFIATLNEIGSASRGLRRVNSRLGGHLQRFLEVSEVIIEWRRRLDRALS